jgi:hypothetical protein
MHRSKDSYVTFVTGSGVLELAGIDRKIRRSRQDHEDASASDRDLVAFEPALVAL